MRKSKREIENALDALTDDDDPNDIDVTSSVVTVREGEDGDPAVEEHPDAPDGFNFGPEFETASDVVEVRRLVLNDSTGGNQCRE